MGWNQRHRINNLLNLNSKCRFFYIDRDGDWRFKYPWGDCKKLIQWDNEYIEYFIDGLEEYEEELTFRTRQNINDIKKLFNLYDKRY